MLLWLALSVVIITGILWWLKDHYGKGKERFEVSPPPSGGRVPTEDEMIATAYGALPSENQQQATETEIITPEQIESNYQAVLEEREAAVREAETRIADEMAQVAAVDPSKPMEAQIAAAAAEAVATPEVVAAEAAETRRLQMDAFQRLIDTTDAGARDACFTLSCAPVQADVSAKCAQFRERCFYGNHYDIRRCLATADTDCRSERVEACRTTCDTTVRQRNQRTILNQGDTLTTNQRLQSPSGTTVLILRDTGNLELYVQGTLQWSSQTNPNGGASTLDQNPYTLTVTPSGEMVIRNALNIDLWNTNTGMNILDGGMFNAPYKCVVAEGSVALINKNGTILWKR
jgi:hypothetical protein